MADKVKHICPIFNLKVVNEQDENEKHTIVIDSITYKFDPLPFVGNSILKPISRKELLNCKEFSKKDYLSHIPVKFYRSYDYIPAIEFVEENDSRKTIQFIENVEAALRLFKEGDAFCKPVWIEKDGHSYAMLLTQAYEVPSTIFSSVYKLNKQDIGPINEIFEKLQKIDFRKETNLQVAITRLNMSYGKSMPTDKIIDFMIAFEALFVKGKGMDKGVVIATGASFLMGKSQTERTTIYNELTYAYGIRDKIVHGSAEIPKDIAKITDKLNIYLRNAIRLLIS